MKEPIVRLINVDKVFGTNTVIKDMNLDIYKGEFLTLLGPSGCGKTTTLRMIAGFETTSAGTITVEDENIHDKEPYERDVNTVFQSYALFPHMTVFDNVAYGLTIKKVPKLEKKEKVMEMLSLVQLVGYEKRKPDELSGGQKQRVAIARALINNPKVLLLDEPLGALDLKLRKQMQVELKRLQKKLGITFIYVTHDQEEALTMSDRIAVINEGIIEQLSNPQDLYEHPETKFVAGFIGESNIFDGKVYEINGEELKIETNSGLCAAYGKNYIVGENVNIAVRPEHINYSKTPTEEVSLKGRIRDFTYVGNFVKTAVVMEDGKEIKISRFEMDNQLQEDDQLFINWNPTKAVVIRANEK